MQNLWILEELASQHRLDINRMVPTPPGRSLNPDDTKKSHFGRVGQKGLKRRWGLFVSRNRSEASLGLTPRRLQNRRAGW